VNKYVTFPPTLALPRQGEGIYLPTQFEKKPYFSVQLNIRNDRFVV